MENIRRIISLILTCCLILSLGWTNKIYALEISSWQENIEIQGWAQAIYEKGEDYGLLTDALIENDSNILVTREQYAEIVVKLYEAITGDIVDIGSEKPFTDTSNEAVIKANILGIVNGTGGGLYKPDNSIKRQELVAMYYRMIKLINEDVSYEPDEVEQFSDDSNISGWAKEATYFNKAHEIVIGTGDNTFKPLSSAMFSEAITIAVRVYESNVVNVTTDENGYAYDTTINTEDGIIFIDEAYATDYLHTGNTIYAPNSDDITMIVLELSWADSDQVFDYIDQYILDMTISTAEGELLDNEINVEYDEGWAIVIYAIEVEHLENDVFMLDWNDFGTYLYIE